MLVSAYSKRIDFRLMRAFVVEQPYSCSAIPREILLDFWYKCHKIFTHSCLTPHVDRISFQQSPCHLLHGCRGSKSYSHSLEGATTGIGPLSDLTDLPSRSVSFILCLDLYYLSTTAANVAHHFQDHQRSVESKNRRTCRNLSVVLMATTNCFVWYTYPERI